MASEETDLLAVQLAALPQAAQRKALRSAHHVPMQRYDGSWQCIHKSGQVDSSSIVVDQADKEQLPFDDATLKLLSEKCADSVVDNIPGLRYWEVGERCKMKYSDNLCAAQQQAFSLYWIFKHAIRRGRIFLDIGSGGIFLPATLSTDKYNGLPPSEEYGSTYDYSHMQLDADKELPFFSNIFAGVNANHSFEHLRFQERALKEWLRVTEPGGYVCIVTPDMTFIPRGEIDKTHTREFCADELYRFITELDLPPHEIVEFNTFDNEFSVNVVLRKGSE